MRGRIVTQAAYLAAVIAATAVSAMPVMGSEVQMPTQIHGKSSQIELKEVETAAGVKFPRGVNMETCGKVEKETDMEREEREKEQLRRKELVDKFSTMSAPRPKYSSVHRDPNNTVANAAAGMNGEIGGMGIGILEVGLMMGVGLFL
ncbi:hypothetical protein ACMFMF_003627 [Clarireedia jacksonii]